MDLELLKIFASAFSGAFFAFVFIRISEILKAKRDRKNKNIKSLLSIQYLCNENYNTLNDTIYSLNDSIRIFEEAKKRNQDPYTPLLFKKLSINKEIILELTNNDFVNDYFSYSIMVAKHNDDIESINTFKNTFQIARLSSNISPENYIENMNRLKEQFKDFIKYCYDSMDRTQEILVKCRVLLNKENPWYSKLLFWKDTGYPKNFKSDYEKELLIAKKEVEQVKKNSEHRNLKIENKAL